MICLISVRATIIFRNGDILFRGDGGKWYDES